MTELADNLEELERLRDGYFNLEVELAKSETRREKAEADRNDLLAVCEGLVANLPDEIFEWIGDSISWSNVSAIKNAREAARVVIAKVTKGDQ